MSNASDVERFKQDRAAPDAMAASCSGLRPASGGANVTAPLRTGGSGIADLDLQSAGQFAAGRALSDNDLDRVCGGRGSSARVICAQTGNEMPGFFHFPDLSMSPGPVVTGSTRE